MPTFSNLLHDFRVRSHMTMDDLAKRIDTSLTYISHLESGRSKPPTLEKCRILSRALNLSHDETELFIDTGMLEKLSPELQEWVNELALRNKN